MTLKSDLLATGSGGLLGGIIGVLLVALLDTGVVAAVALGSGGTLVGFYGTGLVLLRRQPRGVRASLDNEAYEAQAEAARRDWLEEK